MGLDDDFCSDNSGNIMKLVCNVDMHVGGVVVFLKLFLGLKSLYNSMKIRYIKWYYDHHVCFCGPRFFFMTSMLSKS
mgnify:CR=1 FL=1